MKLSTQNLARAASRHPWRTVGAWLAAVVAAVATIALFLGSALTTEQRVTNDPDSAQANSLLERLPNRARVDEVVVIRSRSLTVDDPAFRRAVDDLFAAGRASGAIARATNYYRTRDRSLVSRDRRALLVPITLREDPEEKVERVVELVQRADGRAGLDVSITGTWTADRDFVQLSQDDLKEGELFFGLPTALVILLLVFGAVVAGLVPLLLALVSIAVALALTALIGQAFELSFFVVNMLSGMGLALGIDYSLFVLSRYREERRRSLDKLEAIVASGATASRAVFFSGVAFVIALLGMLLVPDTIMRSLALGAILVGIVSVLAALTLLPAVLSLLGDRINSLAIPVLGARVERQAGREAGFWSRVAAVVMRRPGLSLVVSVALLLAAAAPVVDLKTGFAGISTLPDRFPSKQGFLALSEEFPTGRTDPAEIVIEGDVSSTSVRAAIEQLRTSLAADRDFGPATLQVHAEQSLAVLSVPVGGDPTGERSIEAVERLRDDYIPQAFANADARALVTGETAEAIDYFALTDHWLPIVFAFVLGLSFVLLTIAFRSLVVPLKAIVLNLLSVGAAYGLLVLVFQKGIGNELLGLRRVETVEAWVPLFLFSVLFALSMDYHVFLLSRIRERFAATGRNSEAVAYGVGSTARLITGAALIIIAVFSGFAMGDLVMFQQMGFGVAVALLIDATIVRSVLVPASMELLGNRNWYLPSWLRWLPEMHVEGGEPERSRVRAAA